ncbi:MAG: hypothetical protein ACI4XF_07145 [Oscillospiraceae bacterium]
MKLSYRDKVIFIAVVVVAVLMIGFFFFVKPKISESQDVKNSLEQKEQEQAEVNAKIETLPQLQKQLDDSIKEVDDMQEDFVEEQETFQADQYIYELLAESGVQFRTVALTGELEGELSPYFYEKMCTAYDIKINADLSGDSLPQEVYDKYYETYPEPAEGVTVAVEEVSVTFGVPLTSEGFVEWDYLFDVIDTISLSDKTLYIKSISGGNVDEGDAEKDVDPSGEFTVVIDVFSIQHMDTEQAK